MRITLFSLAQIISVSLIAQTIKMPSVPEDGVKYTFDQIEGNSEPTAFSDEGPWDFSSVKTSTTYNEIMNNIISNNNKILKKLNENRIMEEKKNFLLNNRVFYILSTIESLLSNTNFKDFMDFKDTKEKSRKKINTNLLKNFYPKIIESFLYRKIISQPWYLCL